MREIHVETLRLENFKATRDATRVFAGQECEIVGDNATGKTTLMDAHWWLLTGKDSLEQAAFDIKPLDDENNVIPGLVVNVTGTYTNDLGERQTFSRTYKEKYTTKRGNQKSVFDGHTTDYEVNSVPLTESDFNAKVAAFFGGTAAEMRLVSDPMHAAGRLHWKTLREELLKLSGDVSLEQVIEHYPKFESLKDILGAHTVDDYRKILEGSRKKVNDALKEIPTKQGEVGRMIGEHTSVNVAPLRAALAELQEKRASLSANSVVSELRTAVAEAKTEVANAEAELAKVRSSIATAATSGHAEAEAKVRSLTSALNALQVQQDASQQIIQSNTDKITKAQARLKELIAEYQAIRAREFTFTGDTSCAACGQDLPSERVDEARAKAEALFNERRAAELRANQEEGTKFKGYADEWQASNAKHEQALTRLASEIETAQQELNAAKEVAATSNTHVDYASSPDYIRAIDKLEAAEAKETEAEQRLEEARTGSYSVLVPVDAEIAELNAKIAEAESVNAKVKAADAAQARMAELEEEESKLAAESERISGEQFLIEEFIRARVSLLEQLINQKFAVTKFKLFETQVNGGLNEICVPLLNGIPYASMNTAGRINVGLDICNVLGGGKGLTLPIFVDHCESNSYPLATDAQQIRLIVVKGSALELQPTKELQLK